MWLGASSVRKLRREVNAAVEAQAAIRKNVNPLSFEIGRGIDDTNLARLDKVVSDQQVLLVGANLDIVGSDDALVFIRVIETLNIIEVRNIKRSNMVADCKRKVGELAVIGYVRVDGKVFASTRAKVVKQLCDSLVAVGVFAEGVDDPDLTRANGGGESS